MHGEIQKVVVTSVVMKLFLCQVRQALAGDFIDPVAISRLKTCGWVSGEGLRAGPSLFNEDPALGACPRLVIVTRMCWFESDVSIV